MESPINNGCVSTMTPLRHFLFDNLSTSSLDNLLVSKSTILSFDGTKSVVIILVDMNCLIGLCHRHIWQDISLYIVLFALPIAYWQLQYSPIIVTGFGHLEISFKNWCKYLTYFVHLSDTTNQLPLIILKFKWESLSCQFQLSSTVRQTAELLDIFYAVRICYPMIYQLFIRFCQ